MYAEHARWQELLPRRFISGALALGDARSKGSRREGERASRLSVEGGRSFRCFRRLGNSWPGLTRGRTVLLQYSTNVEGSRGDEGGRSLTIGPWRLEEETGTVGRNTQKKSREG